MGVGVLHGDFETRSACDLRKTGVEVYARHPTTDIICFAFAFDQEPVQLITRGQKLPERIRKHIVNGGQFHAHNAAFEYAIWNQVCTRKYAWPALKRDQLYCTMTMAYALALPGSLEQASAAVGLEQVKDQKGHRIMLQLSKPRKIFENGEIVWWEDSEKKLKVYEYCKQDVEVERFLEKRILPLPKSERKLWLLDQKINARGVHIDIPAVERTIKLVEAEKKSLNEKMQELTEGYVPTYNSHLRVKEWLHMEGVSCEGVSKEEVKRLLEEGVPKHVKEVLLLRKRGSKSSTAKLQAMKVSSGQDNRSRGLFQYHGASTGRWAGRRIQLQNLPRGKLSPQEVEEVFKIIKKSKDPVTEIELFYGDFLDVVSSCIRGFICAEKGNRLIGVDFSAIEARVVAWLAGEERVLDLFRKNEDVYVHAAADIYGIGVSEVSKDQRQIGKVAILALGYQGGVGAFQTMASAYGVQIADAQAKEIVTAWREKNPNIKKYWYSLEAAALQALRNPSDIYKAGAAGRQISFKKEGSFLLARIPSGRVLSYPYPRIEEKLAPWGDIVEQFSHRLVDGVTRKWVRRVAYGGLLTENVTQAVARDLLAQGMLRLEEKKYPIVLHVHDEVGIEVKENFGSLKEVEEILSQTPHWAKGLPISAEGWEGIRYRK